MSGVLVEQREDFSIQIRLSQPEKTFGRLALPIEIHGG